MKKFLKRILVFIKNNWFKILIVILFLRLLSTLDDVSNNARRAANLCSDAETYCSDAESSCGETVDYCSESESSCSDAQDACESMEYSGW